jgi:hypothetical protein
LIDISCQLPCSLLVKNSQGAVLKKIPINTADKTLTAVYDAGFFSGVFQPFATADLASQGYDNVRFQVQKKIEATLAAEAYGKICQALQLLFTNYDTGKLSYIIAGVKAKDRTEYTALDAANEQYKLALLDYFSAGSEHAAPLLKNCVTAYNALLTGSSPAVDANVKDLLHFNLSGCSMLLGDFVATRDHYQQCSMKHIDAGDYYKAELGRRIDLYQLRQELAAAQ